MSRKPQFWKLENPYWAIVEPTDDVTQWILSNYRNGIQSPLYSIPYIECPRGVQCVTGGAWALGGEFPFRCPLSLIGNPLLEYGHGPLPVEKHQQLIQEIEVAFAEEGIHYSKEIMNDYLWLAPGSRFADFEFKIGCSPPFHFLWADIGWGPTIKQEVKEAFAGNHVTGVTFHEVDITFVGKGEPDEIPYYQVPPSVAKSDITAYFYTLGKLHKLHYDLEPTEMEPRDNPQSYGPLYYLRVSHRGPDWEDWTKPPTCKHCGYREQPEKPEGLIFGREHILDGHDIFRSAVAGGIVVSEKVHDIIMDHKFTNVHLTELPLNGG